MKTTVTVILTDTVLLSESVTEYVASYSPTARGLTFPTYLISFVKSPSSASVAVIPSSGTNVVPFSIVLSVAPLITGGVFVFVSTTVTVILTVTVLLSASVTEYVTSYAPATEVSTSPLTWMADVKSPSSASLALTPARLSNAEPFSICLSAAPLITGLVFVFSLNTVMSKDASALFFPLEAVTVIFTWPSLRPVTTPS